MNVVGSLAIALWRLIKRWRRSSMLRNELKMIAARPSDHLLDDLGLTREQARKMSKERDYRRIVSPWE